MRFNKETGLMTIYIMLSEGNDFHEILKILRLISRLLKCILKIEIKINCPLK